MVLLGVYAGIYVQQELSRPGLEATMWLANLILIPTNTNLLPRSTLYTCSTW